MCAVYAVLNACKLLFDHSETQDLRLFKELCLRNPGLFPRIVYAGTEVGGVRSLLETAANWAWREHRRELRFTRPAQRKSFENAEAFFCFLRDAMTAKAGERTVAILGVDRPWDHWTTVQRVGARRVVFFDSWGFPGWTGFDYFVLDTALRDVSDRRKAVLPYRQTFVLKTAAPADIRRNRGKTGS